MRRVLVVLVAVVVVLVAGPATAAATSTPLVPPVAGEVLQRFDAPTPFGPGHRGVDLVAPPGTPVGASAAGRVTFAGTVVGERWVTVDHGRLRTTVGPLATLAVQEGRRVAAGDLLGTSGRAHGLAAVHWSLRRGDTYLDPLATAPPLATLVAGPAHGPGTGVVGGDSPARAAPQVPVTVR